jgi:hypothetical protein
MPTRWHNYKINSTQMTLIMELRDGPTGQLLAVVFDRHVGPAPGYWQISDSLADNAEFRGVLTEWAKRLVTGLDKLSGKATRPADGPGMQ